MLAKQDDHIQEACKGLHVLTADEIMRETIQMREYYARKRAIEKREHEEALGMIEEQKEKISSLNSNLSAKDTEITQLNSTVTSLNSSLSAKDAEISALKAQLAALQA